MEMITVAGVGIWIAFLPPSGSVTEDRLIQSPPTALLRVGVDAYFSA